MPYSLTCPARRLQSSIIAKDSPCRPGSTPLIFRTLRPLGTWAASTKATAPGMADASSAAVSLEYTILRTAGRFGPEDLGDPVLPELRFRHLINGLQHHFPLARARAPAPAASPSGSKPRTAGRPTSICATRRRSDCPPERRAAPRSRYRLPTRAARPQGPLRRARPPGSLHRK